MNHLKVFGCYAYAIDSSQGKEKIDEKREKFIFIGYNDALKGYHLFNPNTNKLFISRDVIFYEMASCN